MKENIIRTIEENKLIAILRGIPKDKLLKTAKALYDGGVRLLEITYNFKNVTDEETAQSIKELCDYFNGKMFIGAGTVLTKKQVLSTQKAGGKFIISPNADKKIIKLTNKCGLVSMPGALTPSEICDAHNWGADFVKLFPITNLGIDYVKAVKAPLNNIKLLAVGGIDENNIPDYLKVGISGFGVGSNIVKKDLIENDDYVGITKLAENYVKVINNG